MESTARAAAVAEVQPGRFEGLVGSLVDSREFTDLRRQSQAADVLEAFYAGLLNRAPDSAGADAYLDDIVRGQPRGVIMSLVQSSEFEASLPSR